MNFDKINLRGPSTITLEPFKCDICGKPRSAGHKKNQHATCSKLRQKLFAARRAK